MDFINSNQWTGIALAFFGLFLLSLCSKLENKRKEKMADPRYMIKQKSAGKEENTYSGTNWGTALALLGSGLALGGVFLFFSNI